MPSCLSVGSRLLSRSGAFSGLRTAPSGGTALTSSRGSRPRRNHRPSPRITVTIAAPMMESGPPADEKQPVRPSDPGVLQVLANEHWSLLATRSLTYNESLSRVSMFLSVLSGAVIALAVVAGALGALVARAFGAPTGVMVGAAIAGFVLTGALIGALGARGFSKFYAAHTSRFPSEEPAKEQ